MALFGPPDVKKLAERKDVKRLIRALGYEKDPGVRDAAARALGRLGDVRAVEPLVVVLHSGDLRVREAAVHALGQLGDARAVEPLTGALSDSGASVRRAAARVLGQLGDERSVDPLRAALQDADPGVCQMASQSLEKLGWTPGADAESAAALVARGDWEGCVAFGMHAVAPLAAALRRPYEAAEAARALGRIGDPSVVEPLVGALKDVPSSREAAAEALVKIGTLAVEPLISALKDEDKAARQAACVALGQIGDARAVEPLIGALRTNTFDCRRAAADALGQIGDARAVEPLIVALYDNYAWEAAARALVQIGAPAIEALIDVLKSTESWSSVKSYAADVLDRLGWKPDRGVDGAVYWIAREEWDGCVQIGSPAVAPLIGVLQDPGNSARGVAAAQTLGQIGDARAVAPLIAVLGQSDNNSRSRRQAAAKALVNMYRQEMLDEWSKSRILSVRKTITETHRDSSDPCEGHSDRGVGIDFTL